MTETLRNRITGAAVLISLLVLAIALWFDGAGVRSERPVAALEVPEAPARPPDAVPIDTAAVQALLDQAAADRVADARHGPQPAELAPVDPTAAPPSATPRQWAVQVGAFGNVENAAALRDRLHAGGVPALLSRRASADGTQVRVLVGPWLERALAEQRRDELHDEFGLTGMVVELRLDEG